VTLAAAGDSGAHPGPARLRHGAAVSARAYGGIALPVWVSQEMA
jgi:hypothetical protein